MGGSAFENDWEFTEPSCGARTIVLVGRTGNGKSATGNSILGFKAFNSRPSSSGITSSCELQSAVFEDGRSLTVIDTPGLFDFNFDSDFASKEIANCIHMAKDGIHAVVLVLTVRSRFTEEEGAAVRKLQSLFGRKITDYMIVLFTGGDDLEDSDQTLDDYLGRDCPGPLKEILSLCNNRVVLFNNKTKDELKRVEQVSQLMKLINNVALQNDDKPVSNTISSYKPDSGNSNGVPNPNQESTCKSNDRLLLLGSEMSNTVLMESTIGKLEQQLAEERAARIRADDAIHMAQQSLVAASDQLLERVERTERDLEKYRRQDEKESRSNESWWRKYLCWSR